MSLARIDPANFGEVAAGGGAGGGGDVGAVAGLPAARARPTASMVLLIARYVGTGGRGSRSGASDEPVGVPPVVVSVRYLDPLDLQPSAPRGKHRE